ncbi:hypothetical protein R50072_12130 [Simiduia litorea]
MGKEEPYVFQNQLKTIISIEAKINDQWVSVKTIQSEWISMTQKTRGLRYTTADSYERDTSRFRWHSCLRFAPTL